MKLTNSIKGIFLLCLHLGGALLDIAEACSCTKETQEHYFKNSDFVFRGIVKNIPDCINKNCNEDLQVTIDVYEIFKGELSKNPIVTVRTGGNDGLCGLAWNEKEEWIVYLKGDFAGSCGGSIQIDPTVTTRIDHVRGLSEAASKADESFSACLVKGTCHSNDDLCCSGNCRKKTGKCTRP